MSQSLEDFVTEQELKLKEFKAWWIEQNKDDPEAFPMEFPNSNQGIWNEMIDYFDISWMQSRRYSGRKV